jgi:PPOX class probable F420-dependent enzyme
MVASAEPVEPTEDHREQGHPSKQPDEYHPKKLALGVSKPVSAAPPVAPARGGPAVACYRAAMAITFSAATLSLLDGRNYAVMATVNPDGSPQTSAVWVGRDGEDLLFSTVEGRVKHRNMLRDPRVSVTVLDSCDPENYVELRGRVSMTPDVGRRVDTQLSWKYDGKDPGEDRPGAVRVVVRMIVEKATGYAA